jgi:outer membrane protein
MRVSLFVTSLLAISSPLAAQVTLDQAVAQALSASPAIRAAGERAEAARSQQQQARGFRLPEVDLLTSYSRTDNPAEVFALMLNQGRFNMQEFFSADPNTPEPLDTWMTRLELRQPVYTGGQLSARIGQATAMMTAEELSYDHAREQVAYDTIAAYVGLAKAREQVALVTQARETTAAHVALAESYAEQGLILQAELLKARVYLAEVEEMLAQAQNGATLAQAALNFHLGSEQSRPIELAPLPPVPVVVSSLEERVAQALDERRDLAAARRQLEAGRLEEKVARSAFLPEVGILGRYELYDDQPLGSNGSSGSVMAVARLNLFHGGSDRAALQAARHRTTSGEADVQRFEEAVTLGVRQTWYDLDTARLRQATAVNALASAIEALRVREERFKQGLDKMIDLLDAETALRQAQLREMVARYDIALSTYRLHFETGQSLTLALEE